MGAWEGWGMTVTDALFAPLFAANPGRPLITHYDDAAGTRVELSRATIRNWAAKTANWLRDEHDVEPGDPVAVLLPAHWQTAGVLLGAWWCGATVTDDPADAKVAVVAPGVEAPGALVTAVASLHPMGLGSGAPVDYNDDVRVFGDDFAPWEPIPGHTPALLSPLWTRWWRRRTSGRARWASPRRPACCPLWSGPCRTAC